MCILKAFGSVMFYFILSLEIYYLLCVVWILLNDFFLYLEGSHFYRINSFSFIFARKAKLFPLIVPHPFMRDSFKKYIILLCVL